MFFHLLYIHLFRPFLKYKPTSSPLPAHVSPRKFLTQAANAISKLLRLYRRTYGLRQICNIVVYITHSACTVHLLNLPDRFASRDIVHGLNHLEEISESWLCVRRTLSILHQVSKRWAIDLPEPAQKTFERADAKFGPFRSHDNGLSRKTESPIPPPLTLMQPFPPLETNTVPPSSQDLSAVSDNECMSSTIPPTATANPTSSPVPSLNGAHGLAPQPASSLSHQSSRQDFIMPQPRQQQQQQRSDLWNRDHSSAGVTSPTMMFGGLDSLLKDQEWWLQNSNQIFANWNGYEQHDNPAMTGASYTSSNNPAKTGDGANNGMGHITGTNGLGSGMYNTSAYGFPSAGNNGQM